jgi:hypothetical protein
MEAKVTTKKDEAETKAFKDVDGVIDFLGYIFRYRMKEFLSLLIILMLGYILASNISYSKKEGLQWIPSVKINVEVKK